MTEISNLISALQKSSLNAECDKCGEESKLSDFFMFDATNDFPEKGKALQTEYENNFEKTRNAFHKKIKRVIDAGKSSQNVGFGLAIEKMIYLHKKFNIPIEDCRFSGDPLDIIVFRNVSTNNVNHITFMDIKTGSASLNTHQRQIRDAVKANNVKMEEL